MKTITDYGRILFAIPFAIFGINHFFNWEMLALMYNSFIPLGVFTNFIVGVALMAAAISIVFKKNIRLSCISLAVLLFLFIVSIHLPQLFFDVTPDNMDDKFAKILAANNMIKDIALMGGALMIVGLYPKEQKNKQ